MTITCANDRRLKIYGSPLSPRHGNWAFQYRNQDDWSGAVLENIDILVTHGPPFGHLDLMRLGLRPFTESIMAYTPFAACLRTYT